MKYRPEIDGLRAVAVVPVILFHLGFQGTPGGYVGVDVFFVISGYLITSILLGDLEQGRFSLWRFYERRIRRILPPLFLVLLVCLPLAASILMPQEIEGFSRSLLAVLTFSSNVLFYRETGYFNPDAETKPLLHTWSLGVEEQFYVFFPLLLALLFFKARGSIRPWLWGLLGLSFLLAVWGVAQRPTAAFYLLIGRGWELLAGSLVALGLAKRAAENRRAWPSDRAETLLGWVGFALVLGPVVGYRADTPFPGLAALPPVLGTCLLVWAMRSDRGVGLALSAKAIVGVGLVSYSAYLWHQPLIVFAKAWSGRDLSAPLVLAVLVGTLGLAWASWRFVERPFRSAQVMPTRKALLALGVMALPILGFAFGGLWTKGYESAILAHRFAPEQRQVYAAITTAASYDLEGAMMDDGACRFWSDGLSQTVADRMAGCAATRGKAVIVLGDSHAMNLYNSIAGSGQADFVVGLSRPGCRPGSGDEACPTETFKAFLEQNQDLIGLVLYHQSGSYFLADQDGEPDGAAIYATGQFTIYDPNIALTKAFLTGLDWPDLLWIGPFTEYRNDPMAAIARPELRGYNENSVRAFAALDQALIQQVAASDGFRYLPFSAVMVNPDTALSEDCFLFRDVDHFSACGEAKIGQSPIWRDLLSARP